MKIPNFLCVARGCSVHDWAADGVGYLLLASFLSGGFLGKKGEVGHGVVALLAARSDTTRGRGSLAEGRYRRCL